MRNISILQKTELKKKKQKVIKMSMDKAIKSDLVRGHKVNNIPTVEFELTLEQVKEINEICKPFVITKDETIVPINRYCSANKNLE